MTQYFDCTGPTARATGLRAAVAAVRQGRLVVLPTDTVYGLGADAFDPRAVTALLTAKGGAGTSPLRSSSTPPTPWGSWWTSSPKEHVS